MRTFLLTAFLIVSLAACGGQCEQCGSQDATDPGTASNAAPSGAAGAAGVVGDAATKSDCSAGECGEDCACSKNKGAEKASCLCAKGKAGEPVWCEACKKGYVDGKPADCPCCVKKAQEKLVESAGE